MSDPRDVAALLTALIADDPGRPRITWYGPGAERVELSAKVLANWVAKTANLLTDTLDAGPGTRVGVALPAHWRTAAWLLGIWSAGACAVDCPPGSEPPAPLDVLVTTVGAVPTVPGGPLVVAVALPALATTAGPLPDGVLDGAAEVRVQPDSFVPLLPPGPDDLALDPGPELGHGIGHPGLLVAAREAAELHGWGPGVRLRAPASVTVAQSPEWLLGPLCRNGSLVLVAGDAGSRPDRVDAQEGVTARWRER